MVTITFPDRETENRRSPSSSADFPARRPFRQSSRAGGGPGTLADRNIPFTVKGKTSYEQQVAAIRGDASAPVQ